MNDRDAPTPEEIRRVREWENEKARKAEDERRRQREARIEEHRSRLLGLAGETIVGVEVDIDEHGDLDIDGTLLISFESGATLKIEHSRNWSEADDVEITFTRAEQVS